MVDHKPLQQQKPSEDLVYFRDNKVGLMQKVYARTNRSNQQAISHPKTNARGVGDKKPVIGMMTASSKCYCADSYENIKVIHL